MTASGYMATRYGGTGRNYVLAKQRKMKLKAKNPGTGGRAGFTKRVKKAHRSRTRSRTVVRRKRVHKKSYSNDISGSTFVKCTDVKLKDARRTITPFQRKVMMAMVPTYALRSYDSEFTFVCKAGPIGNPSDKNQLVGWNQLAINSLSPQGIYQTTTGSAMASRLVCSSFHSDWVSSGDPFGLFRQGYSSALVSNSNVPYLAPTLYTSVSNMLTADISFYNGSSNCRLWQGTTQVTLEMRNPQQYGVRVNIYEVGARNNQEVFHANNAVNSYGGFNFPNIGTPSFSNSSLAVDYAKSPLETFILGMARKGINQDSVANSRALGLNDSPDFVDAFRTYKVCSVYIPPGGTLYKHYKLKSRFVDYTHILRNTYDRATKFLVIKTIPEIQLLPSKAADGTCDGSIVGVQNQPGDNPSSYWYKSLHADPHLICSVQQRHSMRVLPSILRTDTYQQYGWVPIGRPEVNGTNIKQNNDIGSKTITGENVI